MKEALAKYDQLAELREQYENYISQLNTEKNQIANIFFGGSLGGLLAGGLTMLATGSILATIPAVGLGAWGGHRLSEYFNRDVRHYPIHDDLPPNIRRVRIQIEGLEEELEPYNFQI